MCQMIGERAKCRLVPLFLEYTQVAGALERNIEKTVTLVGHLDRWLLSFLPTAWVPDVIFLLESILFKEPYNKNIGTAWHVLFRITVDDAVTDIATNFYLKIVSSFLSPLIDTT